MKKLFNLFRKKKNNRKMFLILQWGKNRSIIQEVTGNDFPTYIIDNDHLMNLDERGLIL